MNDTAEQFSNQSSVHCWKMGFKLMFCDRDVVGRWLTIIVVKEVSDKRYDDYQREVIIISGNPAGCFLIRRIDNWWNDEIYPPMQLSDEEFEQLLEMTESDIAKWLEAKI